jgi:Mg2+/Co2+ transporter CorB
MLDGVLELNDTEVESIMTPKKNVDMFDLNTDPNEIVNLVLSCGHTRIPVYKTNRDEIIGILNTKDLIKILKQNSGNISDGDIEKILYQPYFISFNTKLKKQLFEFKKSRNHIAIVVDEYGSMIGVLTLEDIIEEIVGNIEDEHDSKLNEDFAINDDGSIIISGDYKIRDFNKQTDLGFSHEDYSTVAGLVIHKAERIPNEGEIFEIEGHKFEIIQKKGAKIVTLKVRLNKKELN